MAGEEEEEAGDSQQAGSSQSRVSSQVKTVAPPGESFIFAQPVTARRHFRPIYPEEGEIEGNNQHAHGVNVGASTSSGMRLNLAPVSSVAIPTASSVTLSSENPSPVLVARRQPIISSTPSQMFSTRTKSQLEPRPATHMTSSTPTGDDGSEFSESSADTGVDASVIPRPDERDYQREILQLDDESLQTLRESLAKPALTPPVTTSASALPSIEETRKRPRDLEPDQTSLRAEGSVSNRSLFSDSGDVSLGQPQPSALASKRPRFNISAYGSPLMFEKSVLSDSSFKMSPFYPGKTMFGGASAYRRRQVRTQTPRVQVKPKPAQTPDDGGLSRSARRILECLEQMSTPISDAKRIPTPVPGQRGSFLDTTSGYTAVYHRHRPPSRTLGPPTYKQSTPAKVTVTDNFAITTSTSNSSTSAVDSSPLVMATTAAAAAAAPTSGSDTSRLEEGGATSEGNINKQQDNTEFLSVFSKAVTEATANMKSMTKSGASLPTFEFAPKPPEVTAAFTSGSKKVGGKVKSKVVNSGRTSNRQDDDNDVPEDLNLPTVTLTMSSLPKIDFTSALSNSPAANSGGFKFASPEVVHGGSKVPSDVTTSLPVFTFSSPAAVGHENVNDLDSSALAVPSMPLLFNCSSGSAPKLKEVIKKDKTSSVSKLKEGSILDILKPKSMSPEKTMKENSSVKPFFNSIDTQSVAADASVTKNGENNSGLGAEQSSTINNVSKKTESSQVFQGFSSFMKSSDEWECSVCMIRNKNTAEKCIACETPKSAVNSVSNTGSHIVNALVEPPPAFNSIAGGWGNAFKKSDNEWECEMCMVRNKDTSNKCVACETPKPGSKSELSSQDNSSKVLENKEEKTNLGFGSMFAKAKGEWECATCLVRNNSDASKCISCETPKPGAVAVSQAITGNFRFGVNTNDSSTSSTFKFGVSNSQSEVKSSGFSFGVSAKNTNESNSKVSGGFKFGVSEEVNKSALTESSKGVASDKSNKEKSEGFSSSSSSSSGFTFGVKSTDKTKETDRKVPNFNFSSNKLTENKSDSENATKSGFNFKVGSSDTPFSFGAGLKRKNDNDEKSSSSEIKPASELKSGSVADVLKPKDASTSIFTFGNKIEKPEGDSVTKLPVFNNALSSLHNDGESKNITPTFGSSKVSAPSLIFGNKTGESTSITGNSFTIGPEVTKSNALPTFPFSPVNDEAKSSARVPSFTFGSKTESADSEEPSKKLAFGSSSTLTNNNVNSKAPQLFTFGSKENTLTAFGPSPTSTPAFGAPAPTCNVGTPFQFGHNNNPVPAATAPAPSFGNAAAAPAFSGTAAFGSNNSTSAFAFGQGPKKSAAGYDFGQAAAVANAFNFSRGDTTASAFKFGQKPGDASTRIFQFGTGGTPVETPTFGAENPYAAPAPPSGRVVKKARRRKQ
ncbi:nuclear pore complex protein Nup153-like isoform X2 [Palaemon carinicauda]